MRIRLLKSWMGLRKYPMGQVLHVTRKLAMQLMRDNIAIEYKGEYPPRRKMKTNLFKP